MKKLIVITMLAMGMNAQADGFVCTTESGLNVRVYNHINAEDGTRNASRMVVSDPSLQYGNKTIASFTDVKSTLASYRQTYVAKVDLRVSESNRGGELIAGTKLKYIDLLVLSVDFSYANPNVRDVEAVLTVIKRNGDEIVEAANCRRYTKN